MHDLLSDDLSSGLADHTPNTCIVCNPECFSEGEVSVSSNQFYTVYMSSLKTFVTIIRYEGFIIENYWEEKKLLSLTKNKQEVDSATIEV